MKKKSNKLPLPKDFVRLKGVKVNGKKIKLKDILVDFPDISDSNIFSYTYFDKANRDGVSFKPKGRR